MKTMLFSLATFLSLAFLNADTMPLSYITLPGILIIAGIEVLVFWYLGTKYYAHDFNLKQTIFFVLIANFITCAISTLIPVFELTSDKFTVIAMYFVLSFTLEWLIYTALLKREPMDNLQLFIITVVGNFITYLLVAMVTLFF